MAFSHQADQLHLEILGSMRNVKMLGLTKQMSLNIQRMRETELSISQAGEPKVSALLSVRPPRRPAYRVRCAHIRLSEPARYFQ